MNYPIRRSDWSATSHSIASVFSFIRHVNSRNRFELSVDMVEETLRSVEENGIKLVSFAIELMQRQEEQSR